MARPVKQGLEYFPLDVDIHDDDKIALISSEFGAIGEAIIWRLFCKIYKNGYYYSWGGDECLLFCRWAGGIFVSGQVDEVVKGCLRRSIFDNRVFEMFGILTSTGIQKRYLQATSERKEIEIIQDYWLLDLPNSGRFKVIRSINEVNHPINEVKHTESTQSKVKESKGEENTPNPPKGERTTDKNSIDFNKLIEFYHEKCPDMPRVTTLSDSRKKSIKARIREHGKESVVRMFEIAGSSSFLNGDNDRGWMANFDWLFKPTNFVKVIDGCYPDKKNKQQSTTVSKNQRCER